MATQDRGVLAPTVRRAGLVDVPAITRLITSGGMAAHYVPPGRTQEAGSVVRLMLAHHSLEAGKVWLAEQTPGDVLAVAAWRPATPGAEPDPTEVDQLLAREVGPRGEPWNVGRRDAQAAAALWPAEPHGLLIRARQQGHEAREIGTDLVRTVIRDLGPSPDLVIAVSLSEAEGLELEELGFDGLHEVRLPSRASLWLCELRPHDGAPRA
ncbi:hypothetical protein [Streptomyces sp. NPDC058401]|uniref:hypothetical protein n=1 Tax=Streptomyces sp. NPDC058401 TaxID=3346480 RepID=UPI003664619C